MVVSFLGAKERGNKPGKETGQGTACVYGLRQACACHVHGTRPALALPTPAELVSISLPYASSSPRQTLTPDGPTHVDLSVQHLDPFAWLPSRILFPVLS